MAASSTQTAIGDFFPSYTFMTLSSVSPREQRASNGTYHLKNSAFRFASSLSSSRCCEYSVWTAATKIRAVFFS